MNTNYNIDKQNVMVTWAVIHNFLVDVVPMIQVNVRPSSVASITKVKIPAQCILVIIVVNVSPSQVYSGDIREAERMSTASIPVHPIVRACSGILTVCQG